MRKTVSVTKKTQQVREKHVVYVRTPRARRARTQPRPQILGIGIPTDVLEFCNRERILDSLVLAGDLISQCFSDVREVRPCLDVDPETGEETVVINLTIAGNVDDLVKRSQQFSAAFVAKAPWPARNKIHVCYNVV